jgi:hypothetical protein
MATAAKKPRARKAAAKVPETTIPAIKGFNHDMTCLGFQFEIGKEYSVTGKLEPCSNGFHACPIDTVDPLRVFGFYVPGQSRYCVVDQSGEIVPHGDDKAASSTIFIRREIGIGEIVERAVKFRLDRAKATGETSNSGIRGAASNSGIRGAASNSGDYGAASNSGDGGAASNSGYGGAASNSGDYGAAFSHAPDSRVMCEGDGQALYCTELASNGSIKSVACGITGRDGIKAGVWYVAKNGKLVEPSK